MSKTANINVGEMILENLRLRNTLVDNLFSSNKAPDTIKNKPIAGAVKYEIEEIIIDEWSTSLNGECIRIIIRHAIILIISRYIIRLLLLIYEITF